MNWIKLYNLSKQASIRNSLFFLALIFLSCNRGVSVTPPDEPPAKGFVFLNSNPQGFNIYLDNKERRRITPDSLTWLTTGSYQITLKKDLWRDTTFTVYVVEGERFSVFVDFTTDPAMKGHIYCKSNPQSAQILINDSLVNVVTPGIIDVLPGNYYIKFHKNNFRDDSVMVLVNSGNVSYAQLTLVDTTIWRDFTKINSNIPILSLSCVAVDKNEIVYIGTPGAYAYSFNGNSWQPITYLPNNWVTCITIDKDNVIYFGTLRGYSTFDGSKIQIYTYPNGGLPNYFVEAIAVDNVGNRFIGTQSGLTAFFNNGTMNTYDKNVLPDMYITALGIDIYNNLWVGMKTGGIARRTPSNQWEMFDTYSSKLLSNNVTVIAASPTGEVWVGFDRQTVFGNGLSYFDGASWFTVHPISTSSKVNAILIDKNNVKWIATDEGVVTFSSPSNVTAFNKDNTGLNINDATGLAEDTFGNIWISTDAGLIEHKGNH